MTKQQSRERAKRLFTAFIYEEGFKICTVSNCYRDQENRIRIISARQATKTEQRAYLDGI